MNSCLAIHVSQSSLISWTLIPHSSINSAHIPPNIGLSHTCIYELSTFFGWHLKHINKRAMDLRLQQNPQSHSDQPPTCTCIDTAQSSLLPKWKTIPHSSITASKPTTSLVRRLHRKSSSPLSSFNNSIADTMYLLLILIEQNFIPSLHITVSARGTLCQSWLTLPS